MTLQKAMRVRSELKKEAAHIQQLLSASDYQLSFIENAPSDAEVQARRAEPLANLDGMSYVQAVRKLFALSDECRALNTAIEQCNRTGHELLFKEAAVKSKLAVVEQLLAQERRIVPEAPVEKTDYSRTDSRGAYERREVTSYNFPRISPQDFGMSLPDLRKQLNKELSAVRDELSAFNAVQSVSYELPEGLL